MRFLSLKKFTVNTVTDVCISFRRSRPEVFCKKSVLRNFAKFTGKFRKIHRKTPKKESLAQVFPCEFCEISKNTFFIEHLRATASVH